MRIRVLPNNIPFVEALITFLNLFPTDKILYGIMTDTLSVPNDLRFRADDQIIFRTRVNITTRNVLKAHS